MITPIPLVNDILKENWFPFEIKDRLMNFVGKFKDLEENESTEGFWREFLLQVDQWQARSLTYRLVCRTYVK